MAGASRSSVLQQQASSCAPPCPAALGFDSLSVTSAFFEVDQHVTHASF